MQRVLFLCLIVGLTWTVNGRQQCDHLGTLLYEDLGCEPIYQPGSNCPTQYSCTAFQSRNDTCLFRGKKYRVNETISDSFITENCFQDCKCVDPSGYDKYKCGIQKCTEWSDSYNTTVCYKKYVVDQCCSIGNACLHEGRNVYECKFEGTEYREGDLFFPSNSCSKCACRRGFRGVVEEPFCKRALCATQVVNYEELENYCAPLYVLSPGETALCCPQDWVCHSKNDTLVNLSSKNNTDPNLFCNFGPEMVQLGQGIVRDYNYFGKILRVTCECILPPLMTCKAL